MRRSLFASLFVASALYLGLLHRPTPLPLPDVEVRLHTPYGDQPQLSAYDRLFRAGLQGDTGALRRFAKTAPDSFLLYRTLLRLARTSEIPAKARLGYLERVVAFDLISPLARDDRRRAQLTLAQIAEEAGRKSHAVEAYTEALPLEAAASGLARLETDPRRLARIFLDARDPGRALEALGDRSAPAIRAPSYAALGDLERALKAYDRWLERSPGSLAAREGKLGVLIALGQYAQARALLGALPPNPSAEAALAEAQGDADAALEAYLQMDSDGDRWRAATLLETRGETPAALPLYLRLAQSPSDHESDYQDDAAFRAYVLARRLDDAAAQAEARARIPPFSYFGLLVGHRLELPADPLPRVTPPAVRRSRALSRAGDDEAALGELLVALKGSPDEATTVALAEALQRLGEYGASTEAAASWVGRGSRARRTWRAAYPQAYDRTVRAEAARWGLEPAFVWAVMRQESLFYPRAVSTSEARGVMQIVPDTWDWLAERLGEPPADPFDVLQNIRYGTFYVSTLLTTFEGDLPRSAAAYNGGPGYIGGVLDEPYVDDQADFYRFISRSETREYVQRVMLNHAVYTALYPEGVAMTESTR